jgi:repressor LexA
MLKLIKDFASAHGYPPTVREIGLEMDISSTSVVDYHLRALEQFGHIRRVKKLSRGIEITGEAAARRTGHGVPIVGRIAAGGPIEAINNPLDRISLPPELSTDDAYALEVQGKSMIEDLIDDGDMIIIKPQPDANNGDIVVGLIRDSEEGGAGEATLKRFYREDDRVRLQPANSEMSPIFVDPALLEIQGKVVAVIRRF